MNRGLVLSGGGFRGIAHIGAIKALEEFELTPTHIAGTSSGAIVGALYAAGCNWKEILEFFKTVNIFSLNNYARNKPGFVDTNKFYGHFRGYFPKNDFEALNKKLFITATNILDGSLEIFSRGEIILPILASAAFPGVFTPVQIGNAYYIDGGTLNNFPVDVLKLYCDQIVGVYVNPFEKVRIKDLKHSYNVLERAYQIRSAKDSLAKFKDCDLVISPDGLHKYGTFSLKDLDTVFNMGYQAALTALKSEHGLSLQAKSISTEATS